MDNYVISIKKGAKAPFFIDEKAKYLLINQKMINGLYWSNTIISIVNRGLDREENNLYPIIYIINTI